MSTLDLYDEYINKGENLLKNGTNEQKKDFIDIVCAAFKDDSKDLSGDDLSCYSIKNSIYENYQPNHNKDLEIILARLKLKKSKENNLGNKAGNNVTNIYNNMNVSVSLEQILQNQNNWNVSEPDKKEIESKLKELESIKNNKTRFWNKASGILKWAIDKGIEVFKIFAPYILKNIQH